MRIIDTHTHFPGFALGGEPRRIEDIRAEFEKAGLSGAWIMTVDGLLSDHARHNTILADACREHRDFFVPFCTVDPKVGETEAVAEMERAVGELRMRGLKLHPWLQAFSMSHPAVLPIVRRAGELGIPVLFHDGTPPYADSLQIAAVAEQCPGTTVILGHSGLDDLYRDAIRACLRHKNVYLCLCSLSSGYMSEIIAKCPPDRILYGSDGGVARGLVETAILKVQAATENEQTRRRIFEVNPAMILEIPQP